MPSSTATDPHTGVFDEVGNFWFTLQRSNLVGFMDASTQQIELIEMPWEGSRPYGIKIHPDGDIYVACNGRNCLYRINAQSRVVSVIEIPDERTTVRRLAIDADGDVWYVNSGLGRLGRFNPSSERIDEWPTPSGVDSHPYAIEIVNGEVWFNESAVRPETLVRFNPDTQQMQSWPVESNGLAAGIIRHMRATGGTLWAHQTANNTLLRITVSSN